MNEITLYSCIKETFLNQEVIPSTSVTLLDRIEISADLFEWLKDHNYIDKIRYKDYPKHIVYPRNYLAFDKLKHFLMYYKKYYNGEDVTPFVEFIQKVVDSYPENTTVLFIK